MNLAIHPPNDAESLHPSGRPTTVRLSIADLTSLDTIRETTSLTRNGLIGLAIAAMLDHVSRTGKLPYRARRRLRGGSSGIA